MEIVKCCAGWAFWSLTLLLSPAIVVFAAPMGYGILGDLIATAWIAPLALTLAAMIGCNALLRAA